MTTIAVLDANLVLAGYTVVEAGAVGPDDVVVPDDCDLKLGGKYRWDVNGKAFIPVLADAITQAPGEPPITAQVAIALGFAAIAKGRTLPPVTQKWVTATLVYYKRYLASLGLTPDA